MWKPPENLRARWKADDFRLEFLVFQALAEGRIHKVGLPSHEGRVDMRAFDTPPAHRLDSKLDNDLRRLRIEDVDFSYSRLPHLRFGDTEFRNCRFDQGDYEGIQFENCRLRECSLVRADLSGAQLGGAATFQRCDFTNASLTTVTAERSTFLDCDFTRARFQHSSWRGSTFPESSFAGEIREAEFYAGEPDYLKKTFKARSNALDGADFSRTKLRETEFHGLDLFNVHFPQDDEHLIVRPYPCFLEKLAKDLSGSDNPALTIMRDHVDKELKGLGPQQVVGIVNLKDWLGLWKPSDAEPLRVAMEAALASCGGQALISRIR
jgi:uncharacterized protein YjbI with pentapeptide repeats